jgi:WXG100 family type VII secretion target
VVTGTASGSSATLRIPMLYPSADLGRSTSREIGSMLDRLRYDAGPVNALAFTTPAAVKQAVNDTQNTVQLLETEIVTLQKEVLQLGEEYTGAAATEFQALMARFNDESNKVNQKLQEISLALLAVHDTVVGTEETVVQNNTQAHAAIPSIRL